MPYHEIRVRPVVRYIVTDFTADDDFGNQKSIEFGEFDNVDRANVVAYALAEAEAGANGSPEALVEPARKLRINWLRGPGEPKEAIHWELREEETGELADPFLAARERAAVIAPPGYVPPPAPTFPPPPAER
jgi:hypothetical protein